MPERGLHAELKEWLREPGDLVEGTVWGYRADIIRGDLLIEIQTGNFPQIRAKLVKLLKGYRVRLVHPIPEKCWVIRDVDGRRQRRVSPRVGRVEEVFNELVYCPNLPLDPKFSLEVLMVHAEETQAVRWKGKKRTRYKVTERHLVKVVDSEVFDRPADYLRLIPDMHGAFTARQLSKAIKLRITLARRMVYCLAKMGVIEEVGSVARAKLYRVKS
jgi:ribosomal protein S25